MIAAIRARTVHLAPGDFISGTALDRSVITVLGSCVAMLLWHPQSRFFACCHFVCVSNNQPHAGSYLPDGRYGDQILPHFFQLLQKKQIPLSEVQVRLCGGASSRKSQRLVPSFQVGQLNRDYAMQFCREHGLQAELLQFGAEHGIKLKFETSDGTLQIKALTAAVDPADGVSGGR
ncbi:MAG: chemotaxis protein CheD [Rheinheimera sp.]|nr:chemotaxis protein CheD [Rheinheimera sp.]